MAKSYTFFARDSKRNASEAFANGSHVRVSRLLVNPITHKFQVVSRKVFSLGDFDTLHRAIENHFGLTGIDRFEYEIGGN